MKKCCNFSIGIDIEEVNRFKFDLKKDKDFLEKIFSKKELKYCFSKGNPAQHLAVRFAAKEATVKALYGLRLKRMDFKKIQIIRKSTGEPVLVLPKELSLMAKLSLSHSCQQAIAFVILTKNK